ncbi:MAG: reverse transcriptase domain-containing protein [Nocardioides sp.]
MPPGPIESLLFCKTDEIADWALRRVAGTFRPVLQQVVPVRKHGHGVRPVAELFLRDQLLYRALATSWASDLPPVSRETQGFDDFQRAPLSDTTAAYVVSSDVSAFYQYIDYNVLAQELLIRTGDADRVTALLDLLEGVTGRTYGLPQQSEPSDLLAETYIDIIHRRLVRKGLRVWRYNDDWRITTASWSKALHAVDLLEHEARRIGLTLNDSKTIIRTIRTYSDEIEHRDAVLKEVADEAELDLTDFDFFSEYEIMILEPDQSAVQLEASRRVLLRYGEHRVGDKEEPKVLQTLLGLLPSALLRLSEAVHANQIEVDLDVLKLCMEMLRTEQTLTPQISRYLGAAVAFDEAAVLNVFDGLLMSDPYITPWQTFWLGPHLGRSSKFTAKKSGSKRAAWLQSVWNSTAASEPVKSGLATTLARHKLIEKNDLLAAYDRFSETGRPGIAAAIGVAEPNKSDAAIAALCREDGLSEMAYDWGVALA